VQSLNDLTGIHIGLWSGDDLEALWGDPKCLDWIGRPNLRPYQAEAFIAAKADLIANRKALVVLATGLGKTVVAGTCIEWMLTQKPDAKILVVAHVRELVAQLERAIWRHLSKQVPTQLLTGDDKPEYLDGVTCATLQTAITVVKRGWRPDFIFIDEAHHVATEGQYSEMIDLCGESYILGVTATPWRGDKQSIEKTFGPASYKLGIEDGMRLGYLCNVKYRVFIDDINWEFVRQASKNNYSIKELNSKLFLPQRDEKIRDELIATWHSTPNPRAIVFCQSIDHAQRMLRILSAVPIWQNAAIIHADIPRRTRQMDLLNFRSGACPLLVAVDVLNEGVDVPDVNIVCFARVTHSRRIFIQQLGRGLRLSPSKEYVEVLDFVSDLRRLAATMRLKKSVQGTTDEVYLPSSHSITFEDAKVESLMTEWLLDSADIELASDDVTLDFPDLGD
jgi:superfamily II DNA or RNA helicase